jgi:hypothetical protein
MKAMLRSLEHAWRIASRLEAWDLKEAASQRLHAGHGEIKG